MTKQLYWVVVRARVRRRRRLVAIIVEKLGPMSLQEADAVRYGLSTHPSHALHTLGVELDRTAYWAEYHRNRQKTDKAYRARRRKNFREWKRRASATARGDMTPWLTTD